MDAGTSKVLPHESKIAEHMNHQTGPARVEPTGGPADAVRTGAVPAIREAVYKQAMNVNNAPVLALQDAPGIAAGEHGVPLARVKMHDGKVEAHTFHKPPTSNGQPFNASNATIRGKATIGKGTELVSDAAERSDEKKNGEEDKVMDEPAFDSSLSREEA